MLHLGTLGALLVYFWRDWLRIVPAGFATIRDRSFAGDPDRRLAWLIVATMLPAIVVGVLFDDFIEANVRTAGTVAVLLLVGAAILWVADHVGATDRADRRPDVPAGVRDRRRAGRGAVPRGEPRGDLHLGRSLHRPGPHGSRTIQLPDGCADHRRGGRMGAAQGGPGRFGRRRSRSGRSSQAWPPRSSRGWPRSRSSCAG